MTTINQKDYLKKYLSKNPDKKKKKRATKVTHKRITIIDDNVDVHETIQDIQNDNEDAPQIVAVIDERPVDLRLQQFKDRSAWAFSELKPVIKIEEEDTPEEAQHADNDSTPPRRTADDQSPPRRTQIVKHEEDYSPPRRRRRTLDSSPSTNTSSRKTQQNDKGSGSSSSKSTSDKKSRWESEERNEKARKTLDGKSAGLQNARDLVTETNNLKKREEKLFEAMSAEISGANAKTIIRDRKTGKVRNLEKEAKEKLQQQMKMKEVQQEYDTWGKGLKQVNDYKQKLDEDVHEMNKPMARYADDPELERRQKEEERDGDPMLAYIQKKKRNEAVAAGVKIQPGFQGEFLPNRFGIRPGHRWDGVSRSNGYEKKWFTSFNERNAQREDVYKWNSEDM